MKKRRVLVLMDRDLVPPASMEGFTDDEIVEWKTEFDVLTSLKEMEHEVVPLGVADEFRSHPPDLARVSAASGV